MKRFFWCAVCISLFPVFNASALEPAEVYRKGAPSVVLIYAKVDEQSAKGGTGFFIDSGVVATNAHVITGDDDRPLTEISVYLKPARVTGDMQTDLQESCSASIIKYERQIDIALLRVDCPRDPAPLELADSENVEVGDKVVAIGHPEQGGLWTLTSGTVSTRIKNLSSVRGKDMFQTDASINHGNSGGPLFDSTGAVIGMNTSVARVSSSGSAITGVNFAIQSNVIRQWIAGNYAPLPKAEAREVVQEAPPSPTKEAGKIVTEKKPYKWNELEAAMAELHDLMGEMRGKVRRKFGN